MIIGRNDPCVLVSLRLLAMAFDAAWHSRNNVRFNNNVGMVIRGRGISFVGDVVG